MAHCKRIAQRPFKPTCVDSLLEKNGVPSNKHGRTISYGLNPIASQNNILHTPPIYSSSQEEWPVHENFANSQTERDAENTNTSQVQQLANIRDPHVHDVLMGRGNFVNYHPGNQYFRTLVKKHFLQYISSCKNEKPKYAELIIDEVCMRAPPGRFLRQDSDTKMWLSVGYKKSLDKTRQALREGAPDARYRAKLGSVQEGCDQNTCSGEKGGLSPNPHDHISRTNSQKSLMTPSHVGSIYNSTLETNHVVTNGPITQSQPYRNDPFRPSSRSSLLVNPVVTTNAPAHSMQSGNNFPTNTGAARNAAKRILASEKLANSVATRLMKSNGVTNANIKNVVALGILAALNGGVNGNHPMQNNFSSVVTDECSHESSIAPQRNKVTRIITDESLVNVVASGVAKLSEISCIAAKTSKRGLAKQISDISLMSNKRPRHIAISLPPPSVVKDTVGAEALLAMSYGDDEIRKDSSSEGEHSNGSDKNGVTSLPPESIPLPVSKHTPHSTSNGIWSTKSLGSFMQCDTCLGAGILPMPTSTMSTLHNPASNFGSCTNRGKMLPNINRESSATDQLKNPSASIGIRTAQRTGEERASDSKEVSKSSSIWTDRIRKVEKRWNIALDETKNFSERVEAIECKALFCREILQSASTSLEKGNEELPTTNTDATLKEVELAEEKWGILPPDGYNLSERIEMIEQTAYSFVKRLELWL